MLHDKKSDTFFLSTGAPANARYKFVRCTPNSNQANCVTYQSPEVTWSPDLPAKMPASKVYIIVQIHRSGSILTRTAGANVVVNGSTGPNCNADNNRQVSNPQCFATNARDQ
uniref:Uncharacterized protein n=1 Tax=Anabas testudineus TaxID=64144 RepID=A0A7N6FCD2_ANATE